MIKGEETLKAEKEEVVEELLKVNTALRELKNQLNIAVADREVSEVRYIPVHSFLHSMLLLYILIPFFPIDLFSFSDCRRF